VTLSPEFIDLNCYAFFIETTICTKLMEELTTYITMLNERWSYYPDELECKTTHGVEIKYEQGLEV
jgi:hypothetical protein